MEDPGRDGAIRIVVETVRIEGKGALLLTGPSSCGKGEIAKALCRFLSIPQAMHLSMGDMLRGTIERARRDDGFRERLASQYEISDRVSILDECNNRPEIIEKVRRYEGDVADLLASGGEQVSQLDWLEYCVKRGLLVPDEWTEHIIDAQLAESEELRRGLFILDGYPRTPTAARELLETFGKQGVAVVKVLHLSITKEQMKLRAFNRRREDDIEEVLESRYQFYIEKVQPCIDYLKAELGPQKVALIDAHQPVFNGDGSLDLEQSVRAVTLSVIQALGLPQFLLDVG